MIRFEHPLTERTRNLLRIEHLFRRFNEEKSRKDTVWAHHLALFTLFEIMECAGRAELKLDILQELERQKQIFCRPDAGTGAAETVEKISRVSAGLQGIQQKFGQHLRENEWLMAVKQRMVIPGGTSPTDLPSYYYWQQLSCEERAADLNSWVRMLVPTYDAVTVLLEILRSNARKTECTAVKGHYQHSSPVQNMQILVVEVERGRRVIPEISANKYITHVRFLNASQEATRGKPVETDIPFHFAMCSFDRQPA